MAQRQGATMAADEQQVHALSTGRRVGAISVRHSGKVLDVEGASGDNGVPIIQWGYHGGGNQLFQLEPLDDGSFRLVAQHSGRVLDVEGGSTENGTRIIQWDWHGGANQRFYIQALGSGYYRVTAQHSGRVLDVHGVSMAMGLRSYSGTPWRRQSTMESLQACVRTA